MKNEHYEKMFHEALRGEGKLLKGFSNFHNYSFGNQMWAMCQMLGRGIDVSPIASYKKWQALGRCVRKGEKAIELCMPVTVKDRITNDDKVLFIFKKGWFALSQTDGDDVEFPKIDFDFEKALDTLKITKEAFKLVNGNVQGYAKRGRVLAINPIAELPHKTMFHEMGHILLGHCDGESELIDSVTTQKNLMEVEAESVAMCCTLALGLEGIEYSRGYINNWYKGNEIPAESIKKVFKVANEILKAGCEKAGE